MGWVMGIEPTLKLETKELTGTGGTIWSSKEAVGTSFGPQTDPRILVDELMQALSSEKAITPQWR